MRKRLRLVLVVLLTALGFVAVPQPANAEYWGVFFTCGMLATPTAVGGTSYVGMVFPGPWVLPAGPQWSGASSITVTCRLQIDDDTFDGTGQEVSATFDSFAGPFGGEPVTFELAPTSRVFLCTIVSWTGDDGPRSANVDIGTQEGDQCDLALGWTNEANRTMFMFPPARHGRRLNAPDRAPAALAPTMLRP